MGTPQTDFLDLWVYGHQRISRHAIHDRVNTDHEMRGQKHIRHAMDHRYWWDSVSINHKQAVKLQRF